MDCASRKEQLERSMRDSALAKPEIASRGYVLVMVVDRLEDPDNLQRFSEIITACK